MAELTAEVVRTIVEEVVEAKIGDLKQDVNDLKQDVGELRQNVNELREDVGGLKQDVTGLKQEVGGLHQEIGDLRQETERGFRQVHEEIEITRQDTLDAIERVLATVQSMHDEDQEEIAAINGRLRNHNERIAKLERLSNLR